MKKIFLLIPLFVFADVNPFNAGNLNSNTPYGLTPDEKAILSNKKNIQKLNNSLQKLQNDIAKIKLKLSNYNETINDKLSAFPTVIDEINAAMNDITTLKKEYNQTQSQINNLKIEIDNLKTKINSMENNLTSIKAIKKSIEEIVKIQNQNFQTLKQSIFEIVKRINKQKPISPKEAFIKARKDFFSNRLREARTYFEYTLSKNYLPATSSFYLGEIAYKEKNYKQALSYYKKSISLYPKKTSFTDKLLYHTGKSFLFLNNKKAAKLSFEKLLSDFPKSKYSKLAKKYLSKSK